MPKTDKNYYKYEHKDKPICPYCDKKLDTDDLERFDHFDEEGDKEFECPYCEKIFELYPEITIEYSTFKKETADDTTEQ